MGRGGGLELGFVTGHTKLQYKFMPLITQHHGVGFKGSKTMLGDLKFQSGKEIQEELETHRQNHRKAARLELLNSCACL